MPVALIVIYNHRFDRNIEVVEAVYRERFSHIFHLVPFYNGTRDNVIPVYETSLCFQGYVAQGFKGFEGPYDHYFFIADDMILNPAIDERNYTEVFQLDDCSGFLPRLGQMPGAKWPHDRAAANYDPYKLGVEVRQEIPSPEKAAEAFRRLGIDNGRFSFRNTYFWNDNFTAKNIVKQAIRIAYDRFVLGTDLRRPKYPLIRSYSDIFIVSATHIATFAHYCGAFAATDLFVEVAIPTALVLSGERIKVESDLKLRGRALWTPEDLASLDRFDHDLQALLDDFPADCIYLHPVKLSKWKVKTGEWIEPAVSLASE